MISSLHHAGTLYKWMALIDESHRDCRLSYPYAVERDGKLYVIYSNDGARGGNRNSAELAIIPVEALSVGIIDRRAVGGVPLHP